MPLKSVYGTILSVLDNVFWYNACLKCNIKNVEGARICQKCKYTGFYFRYRLMIEVDTKYGVLPLSCFGNCLKILFGIDAAGFKRELSQIESAEEMLQRFHNCVASCFVGYSFIFQIKNWSNARHSSCTLVVEKLQHLVGSSELQTVYDKFKLINTPQSAQNKESVTESVDAHSSLENLEVSSLSKSLSFNKPITRQRSLSDSMAFLDDTIIRCLFNKSDSVFFERETKSLARATSTQAVGNAIGSKQDSWFLLNNQTIGSQGEVKDAYSSEAGNYSSVHIPVLDDITLPVLSPTLLPEPLSSKRKLNESTLNSSLPKLRRCLNLTQDFNIRNMEQFQGKCIKEDGTATEDSLLEELDSEVFNISSTDNHSLRILQHPQLTPNRFKEESGNPQIKQWTIKSPMPPYQSSTPKFDKRFSHCCQSMSRPPLSNIQINDCVSPDLFGPTPELSKSSLRIKYSHKPSAESNSQKDNSHDLFC
ncbi:uncharacterized protein LOC100182281 [Ciona intestinalis]